MKPPVVFLFSILSLAALAEYEPPELPPSFDGACSAAVKESITGQKTQLPEFPPVVNEARPKAQAFADQVQVCEAALGPLPKTFDCKQAKPLRIYDTDGKEVTMAEDGTYHKEGKRIAWDPKGPCQNATMAPGQSPWECALGSRVQVQQVPNGGTWVSFCRASKNMKPSDLAFSSMSVMGFNRNGESCFFDFQPGDSKIPLTNLVTPGTDFAKNKKDPNWRNWVPQQHFSSGNSCIRCHNSKPVILTPFLKSADIDWEPLLKGVGPMRMLGPAPQRDPEGARKEAPLAIKARHGGVPDATCTSCHKVTSGWEFLLQKMLRDLKGNPPKAWMPPGIDPTDPKQRAEAIAAIEKLLSCIPQPEWKKNASASTGFLGSVHKAALDAQQCDRKAALSQCPAPAVLPHANWKAEYEPDIDLQDKSKALSGYVTVNWEPYRDEHNERSGVQPRTDIRFDVSIKAGDQTCVIRNINPASKKFRIPVGGGRKTISVVPRRLCLDGDPDRLADASPEKPLMIPGGVGLDGTFAHKEGADGNHK